MKNKLPLLRTAFVLTGLVMAMAAQAQITGSVFRDFNGNGTQDANEPLVSGVTVNAYLANSLIPCGTATTSGSTAPNYALAGCGTAPVRVEFVIPTSGVCVASGVDYSSLSGGAYGTSVQFANGNSTGVNFAVHNPDDYNQGTTNVAAFVPCYVNGDPLGGGTSGAMDWFVGFPYTNTGTTAPAKKVDGTVIGSVWGVAYSKQAQKVFTAAFIKRHVGLGANGSGAIYLMTETATSFTPTLFFDMDNNAFNTASNPVTRTRALASAPAYGAGSSFTVNPDFSELTFLGTPDPLTGLPEGFGVVGTNTERGLPANAGNGLSYDPAAFDQVGKVGLGDIDISSDGKFLFVTNLYQRKIFRLELDNAAAPTSVVAVTELAFPSTNCPNGVLRPFALKVDRDKLYIGCVCTAEDLAGTDADLSAKVYVYTNPTTTATLTATPVLDIALDFQRGFAGNTSGSPASTRFFHKWTRTVQSFISVNGSPTTDGVPEGSNVTYPQPSLSDIEFTSNGDMVLGFFDRGGHQRGAFNRFFLAARPTPLNNPVKGQFAAGDILIAGFNCSSGTFSLENNGGYTSANGVVYTSGTANGQGPGGSEFFQGEDFQNFHQETAQGGLGVLKGQGEVMTIAMDPLVLNSGGVIRLSTVDGAKLASYELYEGSIDEGLFAKANGLGDVEFSGIEAPIEIGNRVWNDSNGNGIQDPGEAPIANVSIELYASNGTTLLASTTTATDGTWYFRSTGTAGQTWVSNSGSNSAVQPNTTYIIRVGAADWTGGVGAGDLAGFSLTLSNVGGSGQPDVRDNDAILVAMAPQITYTTGAVGQNDHTLDMGFRMCVFTTSSTTPECHANGTPEDAADDYMTFSINVANSLQGSLTYTVTATQGGNPIAVTLADGSPATAVNCNIGTPLRTPAGTAGGGPVVLTITDNVHGCTTTMNIADPGTCAVTCVPGTPSMVMYSYATQLKTTDLNMEPIILPRFDDMGGTRTLTSVKLDYETGITTVLITENRADTPVNNFRFVSGGDVFIDLNAVTIANPALSIMSPTVSFPAGIVVPAQGTWPGDVFSGVLFETVPAMAPWLQVEKLDLFKDPRTDSRWVSNATGNPTDDDDIQYFPPASDVESGSVTYTLPGDLANFIGVGNVPLTASTLTGISFFGGGGNLLQTQSTKAYASAKVTYTYECASACIQPSAITLSPTPATCTGATANNNGIITLTAATNATHYGVSPGAVYSGPMTTASATAFDPTTDLPLNIIANAPNAGATYVVRIFNGADDCFVDEVVTTASIVCCTVTINSAAPTACVPATNTYSLTVNVSWTGASGTSLTVSTNAPGATPQVITTTAGSSGTQSVTFTGLTANATMYNVTAQFGAGCTATTTNAFTAPPACSGCPTGDCGSTTFLKRTN